MRRAPGCRGLPVASLTDADISAATWKPPVSPESGSSAGGSVSSGASGLLAALAGVQEAGERFIMSAMAVKVGVAMARAKSQNWEPTTPPRSTGGVSPWMEQLLGALKVAPLPPCLVKPRPYFCSGQRTPGAAARRAEHLKFVRVYVGRRCYLRCCSSRCQWMLQNTSCAQC